MSDFSSLFWCNRPVRFTLTLICGRYSAAEFQEKPQMTNASEARHHRAPGRVFLKKVFICCLNLLEAGGGIFYFNQVEVQQR